MDVEFFGFGNVFADAVEEDEVDESISFQILLALVSA